MNRKYLVIASLIAWSFAGAGCDPPPSPSPSAEPVADSRPSPPNGIILAFGDSLTAGLGVPAVEAYPARLERKLREAGLAFRVVNAGVSGETTAGGLRRVDWILQNRPDLVILELGANDALRGLDPLQAEKNLEAIIEKLMAQEVRVVLAGMKVPPNYGPDYTRAFEAIYPRLAERYRIPLIPFFLDGVAARPELNQPDGLHPTGEGYRVVVDRIWPLIKPLAEEIPVR